MSERCLSPEAFNLFIETVGNVTMTWLGEFLLVATKSSAFLWTWDGTKFCLVGV